MHLIEAYNNNLYLLHKKKINKFTYIKGNAIE